MNKQDPRSQYSPYVRSYTGVQGGVELLYPPNAARRETFFPEKSVAVRKKFEVEPTEMVSYVKMLETQRALAAAGLGPKVLDAFVKKGEPGSPGKYILEVYSENMRGGENIIDSGNMNAVSGKIMTLPEALQKKAFILMVRQMTFHLDNTVTNTFLRITRNPISGEYQVSGSYIDINGPLVRRDRNKEFLMPTEKFIRLREKDKTKLMENFDITKQLVLRFLRVDGLKPWVESLKPDDVYAGAPELQHPEVFR